MWIELYDGDDRIGSYPNVDKIFKTVHFKNNKIRYKLSLQYKDVNIGFLWAKNIYKLENKKNTDLKIIKDVL